MAFSPGKTIVGITPRRVTTENPIYMISGDPGVTYTKGNRVIMSGTDGSRGCVIEASDSSADSIGRVHKTTVCPAATQAYPLPGSPPGDLDGAASRCLIPIELDVPAGAPILHGHCYASALDDTVTSWNAATRALVVGTGISVNDYGMGGLLYVYDGPGKGEVNIIEDYAHGTLTLTMNRVFNATLTTSSKVLILSNNAAAYDGIGPFGARMDLGSAGVFDVSDGYDDGNFVTFCDWYELAGLLADGSILAINARNLMITA